MGKMRIRSTSRKKMSLMGIDGSLWADSSRRWRDGDVEGVPNIADSISFFRLNIFYVCVVFVLLVFLARLFVLTIVAGDKNRQLAEGNRIRLVEVEAERGQIFDRYGRVLAISETYFVLKKGDSEREITFDEAQKLEDQGLAGEYFIGDEGKIERRVRRKYALGEAAAHVLGYTSVVQEEERANQVDLALTNARGRLGIEASYDQFLTGRVGKRLIEIDAVGSNVAVLGEKESVRGRNIHTTLDGDLQRVAYEALRKYARDSQSNRGAIVIANPNTGEVLGLVSFPSFDPMDIGRSVSNQDNPFFNRAVLGSYPPGSVFKINSALAGLESGQVDANWEVDDVGRFELGGQIFSNWYFNQYGKTDGLIKMERAIKRSNDVYFYRLGEKVGLDTLRQMAIKLGFGQKTGIDLPSEALGLVPDGVWKRVAIGDEWYLGDTMHLAIGQGYMLTTPVQVMGMTSYVASGKLTKPFIVNKIESGLDASEISIGLKIGGEGLAREDSLNLVRAGMVGACESGGTGAPFFRADYKIACKTGTAEEAGGKPHAWFTVYGPVGNPQIVMTVLVERGGEGSAVAAPVAKEVFDWWMVNRVNTR
ncbi:MAG: Penicillin-binding protein 2 [Candidatus Azambacteria bacterium GW2011_GWA1_44_9]|uniref:Penicillin-binding protein 2 n=1 Tax=Candidatus Azambacteria bacterium GW2011_GWA1_44_9 TaxID=1618610 RepID=A0A0G1N992_9BACT|nr:MAG: Penicillin-binding protein 2 [Candidatus Azambacteria bacterium GW2011_GWA1_44_9]